MLASPAHLYMPHLFTHCLPTIICATLMSIALFSIFDILIYATFLCDSILDCLCTYFCLIVFFIPFHFGCVFLTNTGLHTLWQLWTNVLWFVGIVFIVYGCLLSTWLLSTLLWKMLERHYYHRQSWPNFFRSIFSWAPQWKISLTKTTRLLVTMHWQGIYTPNPSETSI